MARDLEPFSPGVDQRVIPRGGWQRIVGALLGVSGLLGVLSVPAPGAAITASICLPIAGALLFWGVMLKYFSALEEKLGLLIVGLELRADDADV